MLTRLPSPLLRSFVQLLWASDPSDAPNTDQRESVLPTGHAHLVLRTAGDPVRVLRSTLDPMGSSLAYAVVGGARLAPYVRCVAPGASVGAMLWPGGIRLLFAGPAEELAERHLPLADLWGDAASEEARERIALAGPASARLDALDRLLLRRLPRMHGLHPAIAAAVAHLEASVDVGAACRRTGYSHRHFVALFRDAAGLPPKLYARVRRFQRTVARLGSTPRAAIGEVAALLGYADQAHLHREFLEFSGVAPGCYRRIAPAQANHLPAGP